MRLLQNSNVRLGSWARPSLLFMGLLLATQYSVYGQGNSATTRAANLRGLLESVGQSQGQRPRVVTTDTNFVRFISLPLGSPITLPGAQGVRPEEVAMLLLERHKDLFFEGSDLVTFEVLSSRGRNGYSATKLQQHYDSLLVFAAQMVVQVDDAGGIMSVVSDIKRDTTDLDSGTVSTFPIITDQSAQDLAIASIVQEHGAGEYEAIPSSLLIFEPTVVGLGGPTRLVWKTEVKGPGVAVVHEVVLVDAHTGEVAFNYPLTHSALVREIRDRNNIPGNFIGTIARVEGGAVTGIADVDNAYDYLGDTYAFYFSEHGRDSLDGAGLQLDATVRFVPLGQSPPYANAFWSSADSRMIFGDGYPAGDDVVAHELTHGVTDTESDLIYANESGAINESFSDMWGEWVDLTNTGGDDSAGVRWLMGENIPGGAIRDMENPPTFFDPDHRGSPFLFPLAATPLASNDFGGVHINSGIGNKLCFLLTDGGTFNGHTVTAMGISAVADLMYECQTMFLTAGSNYEDLYNALTLAAVGLGFSASDRSNIEEACRAVEIMTPIFFTDFASGLPTGWSVVDGGSTTDTWTTTNPGGVTHWWFKAPFMIVDSFDAGSGVTMDEQLITHSIDCSSYQNVKIQFEHYFRRFTSEIGDVDVRIDGGAWQNVARYQNSDALPTDSIDISGLADGESDVQIRWHYYNAVFEWWWLVDNIYVRGDELLDTTPPSAPIVSGTTPTTDTTPTWSWSSGGGGAGIYRHQLDSEVGAWSSETAATGFTPGSPLSSGAHTLYVQERDTSANWSASGSFEITIIAVPLITVTSPAMGTSWAQGTVQTITWTSQGIPGNVRIYSSTTGSTSTSGGWTLIGWGTEYQGWDLANDGSHDWQVETSPSTTVTILVRSMSETISGLTNWWESDGISDQFTVTATTQTIEVTAPSSGASWQQYSVQEITWDTTLMPAGRVKIYYSTDGGSSWTAINYNAPNTGSYFWTVDAPTGTNTRIRVRSKTDVTKTDDSDAFTILSGTPPVLPFISITAPTSGADWEENSLQMITWDADAFTGLVKIYYSANGGSSWTGINFSAPNTGSYGWTVDAPTGTNTKIRVRSKTDKTKTDDSDAFTVSVDSSTPPANPVTVSPTPVQTGEVLTIIWPDGDVSGGLVKIYYSINDGASWTSINYSAPNTGSYAWTVTAAATVTAKIRVRSKLSYTDFSADSDTFEITN